MGTLRVWHGILTACLLSIVSVPLLQGTQWLGASPALFIAILGLAYLSYLLAVSPSRRGRFVLGLGTVVILIGAYLMSPIAMVVGTVVVGLIWLVRSMLFYTGILPALWDGGLCVLSAVCAIGTAIATYRLWLAVWVFFLLQALFVYIPKHFAPSQRGRGRGGTRAAPAPQGDTFARAHRAAEEALQTLVQRL